MNTLKTIRTISILTALSALLGIQAALAENPTVALPPELAPMATKYQTSLAALTEARNKAIAQLQQVYLTALTTAAQKATTGNKADELRTVTEEKDAIAAGRTLATTPSPLLPRELAMPRGTLLRETARVERDFAARAQQGAAEYMRGLAFYETRARAAKQTELLSLIEAEKLKVAGQAPQSSHAGGKAGRNLVTNGDFAQKKENGAPESWSTNDPGKGAVTAEQGTSFLRAVSSDKNVTYFLQNVDRPAETQELAVSVRLRCREMKGQGSYGIIVAQHDGSGGIVSRDVPCEMVAVSPAWRSMNGIVKLRPETKKLTIECRILDCMATVDFSNVRVETR
jgi:hypothetical protein